MKKTIVCISITAFIAVAALFSLRADAYSDSIDDVVVANIEALSENESSGCTFDEVKKNEGKHSLQCKGIGHQCCSLD